VRFSAGGVRFEVEPDAALLPCERESLARLDPDHDGPPPMRVRLVDSAPWESDDPALFPAWEPAVLRWHGAALLSSHRSFTARIDPLAAEAALFRREPRAYPLDTVVRTSIVARLPLVGGLPLHAAGVVLDGRALAFFGRSGAGKTTLAGTSPHPVLSDELVAVCPGAPFRLARSGYWGMGSGEAVPPAPLAALVELAKSERLSLTRLRPLEAAVRLTGAVPVPAAQPLWSRALAVVARLVAAVPVYRMEWSPAEPPWTRLAGLFAEPTTPRT
jgi:hypothetical protein